LPWGTGSSLFTLTAKSGSDWSLQWVDGDLAPPALLADPGNLLAGLAPGDTLRITSERIYQMYSGIKRYLIARRGLDDRLINASMEHDPASLAKVAGLIGVGMRLQPVCQIVPTPMCYENEVDTWHQLVIEADETVTLGWNTQGAITVGGQPYTVWTSSLMTVVGGAALCTDSGSFWKGHVTFDILPAGAGGQAGSPGTPTGTGGTSPGGLTGGADGLSADQGGGGTGGA
jgi:hypothetical protein